MKFEAVKYNLFSSTIWEYQLTDADFLKEYADKFISIRETTDDGVYSGLGNWVSPDDLHTKIEWKPIRDLLINRLETALSTTDIKYSGININCMWGNSHSGKSQHELHHHPNSMYSGVIYLATPGDNFRGNIFFRGPRGVAPYQFLYPTIRDDYSSQNPFHEIRPEVGKIIIFPSWLEHGVHAGDFEGERISLSFNVFLKFNNTNRSIRLDIQ